MATNHYFNNYNATNEQKLIEDLIVESVKIMGTDAYYIPIDNEEARDLLYGEDPIKKFKSAFPIEIYPKNIMDYSGQKEFFSKFGLEIKSQVTIIVTKRTFSQRVPQVDYNRPRDGDLVYVPFLNGTGELFEIRLVNQSPDFHMLGRKAPYFYELDLEKFKYSHEVIDTGVPEIDVISDEDAFAIDLTVGAGTGTYQLKEFVYQSPDNTYNNATTIANVKSWTPSSNTLSVVTIKGEFVDGQTIIGQTSNARYTLSTYDLLDVNVRNEVYDNKDIEESANGIIDFSETNPFGTI